MFITIPNLFSILRILSIPLFIILLSYDRVAGALIIFVFAAVTDALDGFFARWFHQKTTFGAYLDPIADKLLLTSSFVCCAMLGLIPRWLAILVVSRDVIISMGILLLWLTAFRFEIQPSIISKCTTFFQLLTISMRLLFELLGDQPGAAMAVYWITGMFTVISCMHYISVGLKVINQKDINAGG